MQIGEQNISAAQENADTVAADSVLWEVIMWQKHICWMHARLRGCPWGFAYSYEEEIHSPLMANRMTCRSFTYQCTLAAL